MKLNFDIADFIEEKSDRVNFILNFYPRTRTNYALLLAYYWKIFDKVNIPDDVILHIENGVTSPETISRTKRRIVELTNSDLIRDLNDFVNIKDQDFENIKNEIDDQEYEDHVSCETESPEDSLDTFIKGFLKL